MAKGPIERTLDGMSRELRGRSRAVALAVEGERQPLSFTVGNVSIVLARAPFVEGNLLRVDVESARRSGQRIALNNPYYFQDPPVKVRDAAGIVTEDAAAALRVIIADAVSR